MIQLLQAPITIAELPIYPITISIILLIIMVVIGAIMAGAEVAFFNLGIKDVNYLKSKTDRTSLNIVELIETPKTLSSVLKSVKIFCIVVGVGLSLYLANVLLPRDFNIWIKALILLVTNIFLILLVIEVIPKVYARKNKIRMLLFSIPIIKPLFLLLKNIVARNDRMNLVEEVTNNDYIFNNSDIYLREALQARLGHEPSDEEFHIFRGILKFGTITVKQVMTSRMNISAINHYYTTQQVIEKVHINRLSRMPVYKDNVDNLIGVLYTKDLMQIDDTSIDDAWREKIRNVLFVPETKLIEDLFKEFQEKRTHIAVVVDEFGGTSGIVTLEDIMEQIVGEITDEFDQENQRYELMDDGAYIVDGNTGINELQRIINIPDVVLRPYADKKVRTISGVLLELAKSIPTEHEWYYLDDYELSATLIENDTIKKVRIKRK